MVPNILQAGRLAAEAKKLRSPETWGDKDLTDEAQREMRQVALEKCACSIIHEPIA